MSTRAATASPDLTCWVLTHRAMRRTGEDLVSALSSMSADDRVRTAAMQKWFQGFAGGVRAHHRIEDTVMFPALAARVPAYASLAPQIDAGHQRIDVTITDLGAALDVVASSTPATGSAVRAIDEARAHAAELRDLLAEHLDGEDADVLPLFTRHFDAQRFATLDVRALKQPSFSQTRFTVPWLVAALEPADAKTLVSAAPARVRFLWRITRRGYARLYRRAFAHDDR